MERKVTQHEDKVLKLAAHSGHGLDSHCLGARFPVPKIINTIFACTQRLRQTKGDEVRVERRGVELEVGAINRVFPVLFSIICHRGNTQFIMPAFARVLVDSRLFVHAVGAERSFC